MAMRYIKKNRLNKIYFISDVLKQTLPVEIRRNRTKETTQNLTNMSISDFFVFGHENTKDFDNSINSFVGC